MVTISIIVICFVSCSNVTIYGLFNVFNEGFVKDVRLPTHIIPEKYELELIPFLEPENFTIDGKLTFNFRYHYVSDYYVDKIFLNLKNIYLKFDTVVAYNERELALVSRYGFDADREFVIFELDYTMRNNEYYKIDIGFISYLNEDLNGFFRNSYVDDQNQERIAPTF